MESSAIPGGIYSNMGPGMIGLEMSLHHLPPQQNPPQNPRHMQQQQHPHHPVVGYGHHDGDPHTQAQQSVKQGYPYGGKPKNQSLTLSDDDEPGLTAENSADDGKRKMSPWQRMKWTDNMVRLLIMVVFYIGDEAGSEGNDPAAKKKGTGVLQKKGKWKSVSRAMMERGFYVSPQQCEDKFNDLNKRYKRVNDILGKGTACKVVENQSLLETMDLSPKMKEEVKKLLNSKHLFFREMCAYHNSCGHATANGCGVNSGGAHHSPEMGVEPSQHQQPQQQRCSHASENTAVMPNLGRAEMESSKMVKLGSQEDDEDDDDEDDDDEDDEDEEDVIEGGARAHNDHSHEDDDDTDERSSRKRKRNGGYFSPSAQQLSSELMNVFQDGSKSPLEKRQWIKSRLMNLEEQSVSYHCQALELEKQRLKWLKFSSKKEREMEREKIANERMKLENERMVLLLRQKELELIDFHHHQQQPPNKMSDPSSITG